MLRRWMYALLLALLYGTAVAQNDGGQFWVQIYEDRNGNGVRDGGEPLLTRDVAVNLLDDEGVVIASALLDESPNATQGLIGFQYLTPGEYTVVITSPDYAATTEVSFTRTIETDTTPTVVEFGGQRLDAVGNTATNAPHGLFGLPIFLGERTQVARVALSLLGAIVVVGLMTALGLLVFSLTIRRRQHQERQALGTQYQRQ